MQAAGRALLGGGRRLRVVHVAAFALRVVVRQLQRGPFDVQLASPGSTRGEGDGSPPPVKGKWQAVGGGRLVTGPEPGRWWLPREVLPAEGQGKAQLSSSTRVASVTHGASKPSL